MLEESYKEQLEGLLQARSEDIGNGRRPRRRRAATAVLEPDPHVHAEPFAGLASARLCQTCGGAIGKLRLRAMPDATLCLNCRRIGERAGTAS